MNDIRDRDDEDEGEVLVDGDDIILHSDEEDLPDADDEAGGSGDDDNEINNRDLLDVDDEVGGYDNEIDGGPDDSVHTFYGHTDEVYEVACSPTDASLVATGGGDDVGFLWRIGQADEPFQLGGHRDSVSALAFSADGQLLASGSLEGLIQVWDVSSRNLRRTLEGPQDGVVWIKWHPRGYFLLAGSEDLSVWMWNVERPDISIMFAGHGGSVTCGDFTPDGKTICTGADDASLRIWNPKTGESIHHVNGHPYHATGLTCLSISSDSTLALTGSGDGSVHIVNIGSGRVVTSFNAHTDSVESVAFSPNMAWAATGSMDHRLIVWEMQRSAIRFQCDHGDVVSCLKWIGSSSIYIATGCGDGKVRVWNALSGECVKTFNGHADPIQSIAISADQHFLVSVSIDSSARVFEIAEFQ